MQQSYIVEVGEEAVGLIVREHHAQPFRFVASDARLHRLEGVPFATPRAAEAAARLHLAKPRRFGLFGLTNDAGDAAGRAG
jgi:hypothetical protein